MESYIEKAWQFLVEYLQFHLKNLFKLRILEDNESRKMWEIFAEFSRNYIAGKWPCLTFPKKIKKLIKGNFESLTRDSLYMLNFEINLFI